jgi:hypothetical protein
MNSNERKTKLLNARDKKLLEAKQLEAQIHQIEAREKQETKKQEEKLQRILGSIVRTKYPLEQQQNLSKHIPKSHLQWTRDNFPALFPPSDSE